MLPISPEIGDLSALVKHPSSCDSDLEEEVDRLLQDLTVPVRKNSHIFLPFILVITIEHVI